MKKGSNMTILAQSSTNFQPDEQLEKPHFGREEKCGFSVDTFRLWNRNDITDAWLVWVAEKCKWKFMVTLTVKDPDMKRESLIKAWSRLLRYINDEVFGQNYTRKVGHSYFSYMLGIEKQKRGALHLHILIDRPIPITYIRKLWDSAWGIGWVGIDKVTSDVGACEYLTKYVAKGGEIIPFFAREEVYKMKPPRKDFVWWYE